MKERQNQKEARIFEKNRIQLNLITIMKLLDFYIININIIIDQRN